MRLMLPTGRQIGTDRLIGGAIRYDCTPIVSSLEFQCILDEELDLALQHASVVVLGDGAFQYTIIKRVVHQSSTIKDDKQLIIGAYIAVLKGSEKLIDPASKAIYLSDSSFSAALRASGNKIKVVEDVPLLNYFCAVGATPTYEIARKFREEAVVMYCNAQSYIVVKRLSNIMQSEPKLKLSSSAINWVENRVELNHDMPNYLTINADGSTVEGTLKSGARTEFYPNLDARRLRNLSTALVTRGTVTRSYTPNIIAGDVIQVDDDKKYVVLTAAHRFDTGVLGAASVSVTKLWLAEVVKL